MALLLSTSSTCNFRVSRPVIGHARNSMARSQSLLHLCSFRSAESWMHTHTHTHTHPGHMRVGVRREGIQNLGSSATTARPWNREDGTLFQAWRPFHHFSHGLPAFGNVLSMTHSCNARHSRPPSITVTEVQLLSYTSSGTDDGDDASTRRERSIASLSWWLRRR